MPRAVMGQALGPIENYELCEYDPGPPGPGQVRIDVKAIGVSFVDVLNATGKYQGKAPLPFIPGSEIAGVVSAVGEGIPKEIIGQGMMATSWGGAMAEYTNVPFATTCPIPEGLNFTEAAVFKVSALTAWHALVDRGQLASGETLLVLGAGGATGYAAIQAGKYLGAKTIASTSSDAKKAMVLAAGADAVVDSRSENWREQVEAANQGLGIDVIFDPVGGALTETAFRCMAYNGRHLVVGFPSGIQALPNNLPLLKSASLIGVNLHQLSENDLATADANTQTILELASQGLLKPAIAKTFPLEGFVEAMKLVAKGETAGRIVIET